MKYNNGHEETLLGTGNVHYLDHSDNKYIKTDQNEFLKHVQLIFIIPLNVKEVKECLFLPHIYLKCYPLYDVPNVFIIFSPAIACLHSPTSWKSSDNNITNLHEYRLIRRPT